MRILSIFLALGLVVSTMTASSRADIILIETNDVDGTFNGSSGTREVNFDPGLFSGSDAILDIEVTVTFSKLRGAVGAPNFNEISLSLTKNELGTVNLINSGSASFPFTGSFTTGFASNPGFNGTIVFSNSAALPVNNNTNVLSAGTFLPVGQGVNSLGAFIGGSGAGTYTLNIGDNNGAAAPLVFDSFSVAIRVVPEPSSLACLGLLAPACAFVRRRRSC